MKKNYIIGIDLGGTKINGILTDLEGNILKKYKILTNASQGINKVFYRIIFVVNKLIVASNKKIEEIKGIGIGSPGPLDRKRGIIISSPNIPFKNFKLVDFIREKYNIPIFLDNDANVATMGEYMFGAGKGVKNMFYITISTGIGGGAIIDGKIYRGNTSNAIEIGHMTILPDGPKCNCGNYGCIEALSSGIAIAKMANKFIKLGKNTSLKKYNKITAYEVFKEGEKGDKVSNEIINKSLYFLGICVANIITIFDPEIVVIGGGISKSGENMFNKIRQVVNKRCFNVVSKSCKIVPSYLKDDSGALGAVALVINEMDKNKL